VYPKVRLADLIEVRKGLTRKQRAEPWSTLRPARRFVSAIADQRRPWLVAAGAGRRPRTGRHRRSLSSTAPLAAAHVRWSGCPPVAVRPDELRDGC